MDNFNPDWVWYLAGIVGVVAAGAFYWLEWRSKQAHAAVIYERLGIIEKLEEGEIDAVTAGQLLEKVQKNVWGRLAADEETPAAPTLRIQVSDPATGAMKSDLRIPLGLVNTVLNTRGTFSAELDQHDRDEIGKLLTQGMNDTSSRRLDAGGDQIDVSVE